MTTPPRTRAERSMITLWLVIGVFVWNGIYDFMLTRGVKEYLLRAALHEAGRGPEVAMTQILDITVREAVWVSTLWASAIVLAGLVTLRWARLRI